MNILGAFNWVDIIVIILLIRTCYVGTKSGFSLEIGRAVAIVAGFVVSFYYYNELGQFMSDHSFVPISWSKPLALLLVIVAAILIIKLTTVVLSKIVKLQFAPQVEKIGGGVLGVMRGVFLSSVVLVVLGMLPSSYIEDSVYSRSLSGGYIVKVSIGLYNLLTKSFSVG